MKLFATAIVLMLGSLSAAVAQTGEPAGQLIIDENFNITKLDGTGGLSDVWVALTIVEQSGRVVVCAATGGRLSGTLRQVKRAIEITEGGTRIMRGIHWSPDYPPGDLIGQVADCQITNHPMPANPDFGIRLSRSRF